MLVMPTLQTYLSVQSMTQIRPYLSVIIIYHLFTVILSSTGPNADCFTSTLLVNQIPKPILTI